MASLTDIPLEASRESNAQPIKRHRTARYYAHRVKESLTTRVSKVICSIFLTLLLIVGIISFVLWLSLRPHRPRFRVESFSFTALTQETGFQNAEITFDVTDRNSNQNVGIYYDGMEGTVYYKDKAIGATPLLFPFYQPPKNTTKVHGVLNGTSVAVNDQLWTQFMADRAAGNVGFRLELSMAIRFKISTWDSKRHRMHASCELGVGVDGQILPVFKDKKCSMYFD
ncbi:NDR1/HIN1-like protein 26 [Aristolochia californica]|uniref:NDR1/HIN1-like protein 26 n=1 Tax=Aristolochia californica TaxID=171875 RepID=UPI0035E27918